MPESSSPLLQLIIVIKDGLHKLIKTISAYQRAKESKEEEKANTELKVVVSLPVEVAEYYKSEKSEKGKSNNRERIRTILECVGVVAAVILAILTFRTLRVYNSQLIEARRANDDLEKQFRSQQRAWIGNGEMNIKQATFLVYPDNPIQARTQVDLDVVVPLKNVGNSPALNVETSMIATMTEQIGAFPTVEPMMESACGGGADKNAKAVGQVLFPSSPATSVERPMSVQTPFIQINQVHRVWINICVRYSGTTDQKIHHTKIWVACWPISGNPTEIRRSANPNIIYYSLPITQWAVVKTEAD